MFSLSCFHRYQHWTCSCSHLLKINWALSESLSLVQSYSNVAYLCLHTNSLVINVFFTVEKEKSWKNWERMGIQKEINGMKGREKDSIQFNNVLFQKLLG